MVKITGKVRVTGMVKVWSFSGWENITIFWDESPMDWEYWN